MKSLKISAGQFLVTTRLYKIVTAVGEETVNGNVAIVQLDQLVNEHIGEGCQPVGGIVVSSVTGTKTAGSTKNNWYLRVAQALVRESAE